MNFIYDILLDFNTEYYEFYDWNKEDRLIHIRKIPIIKVSDKTLKNIIYNDIKVEKNFINNINNKTEYFSRDYIEILKYACLICNNKKVIAIQCDSSGKIIKKSDLLIDEQSEIISLVDRYKDYDLSYEITNQSGTDIFKTRKKIKMEKFILKEIEKQSTTKLEYLLFECGNEVCTSRDKIIEKIKQEIKTDRIDDIYNYLKLLSNKKKV